MSGDRTNGTLGGRYQLGELLGHGGMADVRKAQDLRLGRTVAVKMLRTDLARDATFQARFRREAQSAASLNAPSVVAVYDTGEDELNGVRVPYIVMEYVEGQTLRELLRTGERLMPNRALEITAGVLTALEYSHEQGIVHRDIKPANVMLASNGDVKVMDFGIARAVADSGATMTQTANVLGTAQYLSPEQARGESVDARSDVYSAGCLLYELLTGRPPFQGESPVAVAYQHVRENPVAPSTINADIGPEVDAIVMKALTKNPQNRYQSAREMRSDIQRALHGTTVSAPPVLAEPPTQALAAVTEPATGDEGGRKRGYVALIIGVVVALALLGVGAWALLGVGQNTVAVPNVVGQSLKQATSAIEDAGFTVGTVDAQTSDEKMNTVLSQDPTGTGEAEEGSAINLVISKGPGQVQVPTLTGFTEAEAIDRIQEAQLVYGGSEQVTSDAAAGTVVASDPPGGKLVDVGSEVTLQVSNGEAAVPDVIGDTEAVARAKLDAAGFSPTVVYQQTSSSEPGIVLDQAPGANETARLGTSVVLTVSEAMPSPSPTTSAPSPSPSDTKTNNGQGTG